MLRPMSAASIGMVPVPQKGSMRGARIPEAQLHHGCGEGFFEGSTCDQGAIATLMQTRTRGIESQEATSSSSETSTL